MKKQVFYSSLNIFIYFVFVASFAISSGSYAQETHRYFTKGSTYGFFMCLDSNGDLIHYSTPAEAAQCYIDYWEEQKNSGYIKNNIDTRCSAEYVGYKHEDYERDLLIGRWIGWLKIQLSCTNGYSYLMHDWSPERVTEPSYVLAVPEDSPPIQCSVGNPISVATGKKYQKEIDVEQNKPGGVSFYRTYINSIWHFAYQQKITVNDPIRSLKFTHKGSPFSSESGACESGWSGIQSNIDDSWAVGATATWEDNVCRIKKDNLTVRNLPVIKKLFFEEMTAPASISLLRADLSESSLHQSNGVWVADNGSKGWMEKIDDDNTYWRFHTSTGGFEDYSFEGKLTSITSRNGIKQQLIYDDSGLLSGVVDNIGGKLTFTYNNNLLVKVAYNGDQTTEYTYNSIGLLTGVTRPDDTTRTYHYEDAQFPSALTGLSDENGNRYATWEYDNQGRAISSEHPNNAEKTQLIFDDDSTTVINSLNKKTVYHFSDISGVRRVKQIEGQASENCLAANQNYTYTDEGWVASKTNWNGIQTTFVYNTLGQETSRTEAHNTPQARTILTEWHDTLSLKTKVIEPERTTVYTYDEQGRLTNTQIQSNN